MRLLPFGIGVGKQGARLAQPETPLPKQALALTHSQANPAAPLDPGTQSFSIPQRTGQADLAWRATQHRIDLPQLRLAQTPGSSGAFPLHQSGEPSGLKASNPILYRSWSIPQNPTDLRTGHPLGDQQHPMQPVIIPRFFRTANLILQSQNDACSISNLQWFHVSMKPHLVVIRNYL